MSSAHYTYLNLITEHQDMQKLIAGIVLGGVIYLIAKKSGSQVSTALSSSASSDLKNLDSNPAIPTSKISLSGFLDLFIEIFTNFQDSILGKENRKYLPFTGSIFLFILAANLLGLVPGMPAITTSVWLNVGMAIVVFIYFNFLGIKSNGLFNYLKHFFGTLTSFWLLPIGLFLFILELCFTLPLRVLTLNMRLYWNITADHSVLEVFTHLLPPGLPIVFYILATFVCFMQAFIFTTLTMVYILLATHHDEEHEEEPSHGSEHNDGVTHEAVTVA